MNSYASPLNTSNEKPKDIPEATPLETLESLIGVSHYSPSEAKEESNDSRLDFQEESLLDVRFESPLNVVNKDYLTYGKRSKYQKRTLGINKQ